MTPLVALILISNLFCIALMPITEPLSSIRSVIHVSVHISTFRSLRDKISLATPALPIVSRLSFQPHFNLMGMSKIYFENSLANKDFHPGKAPSRS